MIIQLLFDGPWRFRYSIKVFKFRDKTFKLFRGRKVVQSENKGFKSIIRGPETDCLATVADGDSYPFKASKTALIYLGCLSWEMKAQILYRGFFGFGTRLKIQSDLNNLPRLSFAKRLYPITNENLEINHIPFCASEEHELAVGLYREALATESPYYKFLCYWNILSIKGSSSTSGWINRTLKKRFNLNLFTEREIQEIKTNKLIGEHFQENYRNAIAHIKRYKNSQINTMDVNDLSDVGKFSLGASILEKLARFYVEEDLKMNQKLYLSSDHINVYKMV